MYSKFLDLLENRKLIRRVLAVTVTVMIFKLINAFVSNPEQWETLSGGSVTIFITAFGFLSAILGYYFYDRAHEQRVIKCPQCDSKIYNEDIEFIKEGLNEAQGKLAEKV